MKVLAANSKASHLYFLGETLEVGIVLKGFEVKSIRLHPPSLPETFIGHSKGEMYIYNLRILGNSEASASSHKLLLHKRQIMRLFGKIKKSGVTCVPLSIYRSDRGFIKLQIAVATGKKAHDKRDAEAARDWDRERARLLRNR